MDYTQSPDAVTHVGTGHKMHSLAGAVTTEVTDKDLNSVLWSLMAIVEAAGVAGAQFDPAVPGSYQKVRDAIAILNRRGYGGTVTAGGTADALTGDFSPDITALTEGLTVWVRATAANATTNPTFAPDAVAAAGIVKGNGVALVAGDIAGAGHRLCLQWDVALGKWILLNPAKGITSMPLASSATTQAGISTTEAVTPKGLADTMLGGLGATVLSFTSPARQISTNYTNSYGRPMSVSLGVTMGGSGYAQLMVDGTPTGYISNVSAGLEENTLVGTVPAGSTYQVTSNSTINFWTEIR